MPATLQIPLGLTGVTPLTCDLFPENSDTAAESGVTLTEATNRNGIYTASVSVTGWHTIKLYVSAAHFPAVFAAQIPSSGTITAVSEAGVVRADNRNGGAIPTAAQNAAAIDTATLATETASEVASQLQGGSVEIITTGPVLTDGDPLTIVQGDDYQNEAVDRRASTTISGSGYGSLTGDGWDLRMNTRGAAPVEVAGSPEMVDANTLRIKFPITAEESGSLKATQGEWSVRRTPQATTVSFDVIRGPLIVSRDLSIERT